MAGWSKPWKTSAQAVLEMRSLEPGLMRLTKSIGKDKEEWI